MGQSVASLPALSCLRLNTYLLEKALPGLLQQFWNRAILAFTGIAVPNA
jgi:hypothetical protein